MSNRARQELEELTVFREFAQACSLPLLPETAGNQPEPKPDILCDLNGGERLAFELVSCEDVTRDERDPNKLVPVTKNDTDAFMLKTALSKEYGMAVDEKRIVQPERFEYQTIEVDFEGGASFKQRRKAVRRVLDLLNERGPGRHVVKEKPIRSIRCSPWDKQYGSYAGPSFSVGSSYLHVGVRIIERIKAKLNKKYECDCKIHLLAWSNTASAEELKMLGMDRELTELLQSNGMGPFDRIWVFGRGDLSIVFDRERNLDATRS